MATSFTGLQSLDPSNFLGDRPDAGAMRMAADNAIAFKQLSGLEENYNLQTAIKNIEHAKKQSRMAKRFGIDIGNFNNQAETMGGFNDLLNLGVSLAGSGAFGGGMDPIGTQGNPFGNVGVGSPLLGIPGGAAVGGGRIPLGGG